MPFTVPLTLPLWHRRNLHVLATALLCTLSGLGCRADDASSMSGPPMVIVATQDAGTTSPISAPTEELEHIQIAVADLTFEARASGPEGGDLVLLLHGFPETSYEWRHALAELGRAGYRAVAPDQRGYSPGARPSGVEAYQMRNLVLDVLGMADALGAPRFHLVGHDWGAVVAWVIASAVPERVRTLTAVSTAHPTAIAAERARPDSCQARATLHFAERKRPQAASVLLADGGALLRAEYGDLPEEAVSVYLSVLGNEAALTAALHWYGANIDPLEPAPAAGPVAAPTLYLWSDEDPTNCREPEHAHERLVTGPYRFEVVPGVDHWLPERAPALVATLLLEHLAAH